MRSITAVLLVTLMLSMLLTSCWSEQELDEIAIVTATGLDRMDNGKLRLSLLIAIPRLFGTGSAQGGGESRLESSAGWVVSEEGDSIMDITRILQKKLPREIFYSQSRVIIIGKKLATEGVQPVLDFFERYRQSQLISYVAVSKTTALDILNFQPKFEKLGSEVLKQEMRQNLTPSVQFIDFLNTLMSEGIEPIVPTIEFMPSQYGEGSKGKIDNIAITGLALFHKDKMVAEMDEQNGRGILWVINKIHKGVITIQVEGEERPGNVSTELERVTVDRETEIRNGKVHITLKINLTENVYENTSDIDMDKVQNVNLVQKKVEDAIKKRIYDNCKLVQGKYNTDVYGFGQSVYRRYPKQWHKEYKERWDELFPQIQLDVKIKGRIIRSGLTNNVIKPEE
ncbi:Ger(x)C family spore germination protein [Paenibacillus physcomitrellae]|uniref:Ger(X)C family spore germination protein n=1 Tax=Paenibacillus physcomitrellae TaxID=1619311 RepID=A0ABQ1GPR0_9BACL|nr:Ger(x)C family spore germination protein [Paenibacillus physcomitrellae]GGA47638.1 hypothetical protein GCM10010917_36160 [Paenibacillus physcomitrellae]